MNRQIKFRGWDGERMYYHDDTSKHGNLTLCFNDISGWNFYREPTQRDTKYLCGSSHSEKDILMQFTGLLDKNGKEIFEGDIVSVRGMKRTGFYIAEVIWRKQGFTLSINKTYLNNDACILPSIIEILGNVFEHPELLNK